MKNMWLTGIVFLALNACKQEPAYEIKGYFPGAPDGTMVYLSQDSAPIVNGKFVFKGRTDLPEFTALKVRGINKYGMPDDKGTRIWLENVGMKVECLWDALPDIYSYSEQMKISGSGLNDLYQKYRRESQKLGSRDSLWKIYQQVYLFPSFEWKDVDVEAGMEVMQQMRLLSENRRKLSERFIAEHPASPVSLELLTGLLRGQDYTVAEAEEMMARLDPALKNFPAYTKLRKVFQDFVPTARGEKYMDVILLNREGKEVKLSDYIVPGKYNMLEFWASWCGPCRAEIPHLRHVNQVLGKEFHLINISIDEKDAAWQKAIKEEQMIWTQLRVPGGSRGEACQKYRITGVPYSLILDGEGRIVAGELRGAELDIVLNRLLGDKARKL